MSKKKTQKIKTTNLEDNILYAKPPTQAVGKNYRKDGKAKIKKRNKKK
jgi:hypothetical protein